MKYISKTLVVPLVLCVFFLVGCAKKTTKKPKITYKLTGTLDGQNVEIMFIHANGIKASDRTAIDLTGYTVYLDALNKYEVNSSLTSITPENYQTIIAIKAN